MVMKIVGKTDKNNCKLVAIFIFYIVDIFEFEPDSVVRKTLHKLLGHLLGDDLPASNTESGFDLQTNPETIPWLIMIQH